jgi:hypothetical protein
MQVDLVRDQGVMADLGDRNLIDWWLERRVLLDLE